MNELNQSGDINQIVNKIYEEMSSVDPYFPRIVDYLRDLRIKEEYQSLSNSEFYDIVGKTFKLNPAIFMKHIYGNRRFYQYNTSEMQKYILEKFSLYEGEQILFEDSGKISLISPKGVNSVSGRIYITNYRIIAQGTLSTKKWTTIWNANLLDPFFGNRKKMQSKVELIEGSTYQELPCYGYQFKTRNHSGLKKNSDGINYTLNIEEDISKVFRSQQFKATRNVRITLSPSKEELVNNLFEVLCRDTNQIMNTIRELFYMEFDQKRKQMEFLRILHPMGYFPSKRKIISKLQSDEVHQFCDSDYFEIVKETYKLDPEFFMTSIYPKMMSWKYSKFLSEKDVKEEIKTLVDKLSQESGE